MNMREKMARALEGDDPDRLISDVIPYNPSRAFPAWRQQLPKIDAVLDAMLEPTEEVIEAGWGQALDDKPGPIWQAMIDAIKAGK